MGIWCLGEEGIEYEANVLDMNRYSDTFYIIWLQGRGSRTRDRRGHQEWHPGDQLSIVILFWGALQLPVDTSTLIILLKMASLFFNFP